MYTWRIWDRTSSINCCKAEDTGFLKYAEVYLIIKDGEVAMVQYTGCIPYPADTIIESAKLHCAELNKALEAQATQADGVDTGDK